MRDLALTSSLVPGTNGGARAVPDTGTTRRTEVVWHQSSQARLGSDHIGTQVKRYPGRIFLNGVRVINKGAHNIMYLRACSIEMTCFVSCN